MAFTTSSDVSIKELIFYIMLTVLMWISSFTFLLPVLLFLKGGFVGEFVSKFLRVLFGDGLHTDLPKSTRLKLKPFRKQLFELLEKYIPEYRKKQLNILDLSLEFKYNSFYYNKDNHQVIVMANNSDAKSDYLGKIGKFKKNGMVDEVVVCNNLFELLNESCDVVISTLRLCSVEDVQAVFKEIKRILKPGGVFAFMEHVGFPEEQTAYAIQRMASPLWRTYFSGCNLNRHIIKKLKRAGFSTISYSTYYPQEQLMFVRPTILGICTR